jgi:hypothetical protein
MITRRLDENTKYLEFDNAYEFEAFWELCESHSILRNFRGEPFNWACFCRNKKYIYHPKPNDGLNPEKYYIEISKVQEHYEDK